jgi:hypothetical protein
VNEVPMASRCKGLFPIFWLYNVERYGRSA